MSGSNRGFMAKAVTAFKYFFTGDDELFSQASSTAKRIPLEDPGMPPNFKSHPSVLPDGSFHVIH